MCYLQSESCKQEFNRKSYYVSNTKCNCHCRIFCKRVSQFGEKSVKQVLLVAYLMSQ